VLDVRYAIANDGADRTLTQLTLQLTDEASPLKVAALLDRRSSVFRGLEL
jgi:hypothetical protein